jgi:hypothetical protein
MISWGTGNDWLAEMGVTGFGESVASLDLLVGLYWIVWSACKLEFGRYGRPFV